MQGGREKSSIAAPQTEERKRERERDFPGNLSAECNTITREERGRGTKRDGSRWIRRMNELWVRSLCCPLSEAEAAAAFSLPEN